MKLTDLSNLPVRVDDVYWLNAADGWDRLEIATSGSFVNLILNITENWAPPYFILYVVDVTRTGHAPGRYQSALIDKYDDVSQFLKLFQNAFENDGRHSLWVAAPQQSRQLVYDRHEILYVYNDNERVCKLLDERGYTQCEILIPVPHTHHYNAEFDMDVEALMDYWSWHKTPLQQGDKE